MKGKSSCFEVLSNAKFGRQGLLRQHALVEHFKAGIVNERRSVDGRAWNKLKDAVKAPRMLRIITPMVDVEQTAQAAFASMPTQPVPKRPLSLQEQAAAQSRSRKESRLAALFTSKEPKWSEKLQTYALNFNGRVNKGSLKNF